MKHIAVRLKRFVDSEIAFGYKETHKYKRRLVNSNIDQRDPALRNLTEGLYQKGLSYVVDDCQLYWFQIEDGNSLEYYQGKNEVECVFYSDWFEEQKTKIRYYQGIRYVDECIALADHFDIKDQDRKVDYVI
ncbi:hypothetical protein [Agarilytica rhodophyticola]|uniref:hypothetical protein n=1 Tax=Agarilytica rhodophyticola TaxID=1737490 RepID=UPI000B347AE9|nr:hypothetical protein [Agarilytica rhodophyticola]